MSTLSAVTILASSLTLAVFPAQLQKAEAFEAPATATQMVRTSNNVWTQTQPSGLTVTYSTGTSTRFTTVAAPLLATPTNITGTPTISATTPTATFTGAVPNYNATGCAPIALLSDNYLCSDQGTMTVTFSQPVNNPRIYIGRLGGSNGSQARIYGVEGRLTSSSPSGVTLTSVNGQTQTWESTATSFGISPNYTGVAGDCAPTGNVSTACASLIASGTGITSITFALDFHIRQDNPVVGNAPTGGNDEFVLLATNGQQFSNGATSYNGGTTAQPGTAAPYHVVGPLQLGSAFTTAGISTTQNTTVSPNAGTATGPGDAFTASSFALNASQAGSPVSITVPLSGTASGAGRVCGWLDWDRSGTYEVGERACGSFAAGATSAVLTWTMPAAGTAAGPVNARFRTAFGTTDLDPTGGAASGEVEDYTFAVKPSVAAGNSAASTAGALFTYGITAGSATATLLANGGPNTSSGARTIYNSSAYGAPDITVTQDPTTTAIPLTFTQTQPSGDTNTYGVSYVCTTATGSTITSGSLGNSGAGQVKTIPAFSLPASASTNVAAQGVTCTFTNTKRITSAVADAATVAQNGSVSTNVIANDSTTSGNPLSPASVTVTTAPVHGTTSVNTTTGAITFTPTPGYVGTDSYQYRVCDTTNPNPVCGTATVTVTVTGNTVVANNDTATTTPATQVSINVRGNDTTATGQALANPTITTAPMKGTATVNSATGQVLYTPANGFSGTDSFAYQVCDTSTPTPVCASATATISVPNQFTNGSAAAGITTPQNTAKVLQTTDIVTVTGAPINPAAVTVTSAPTKGSVSINASTGAVTYTPNAGYSGSDSFTLQLCDTSTTGNTAAPVCRSVVVPVTVGTNTVTAVNDTASTTPTVPVDITVRANDTTATGQALANPTVVANPTNGTAAVNANGSIRYTPNAAFSGTDTFTYRVCDTSTPTAFCSNTATVTVTVPNQFTDGAAAAGITTPQNTAKSLTIGDMVTVTGAPINPAAVTVTSPPTKGSVSINATTGVVTYTPNAGYSGTDSFTVQLCDTSKNGATAAPVCRSVVIPVTVGTNTVTAVNDSATTTPVTPVDITVRGNDTSATGQALANPTVVAAPTNGTAAVNANGTIKYSPNANFSGTDTFTYRVCDTSTPTPFCSNTATVTVTVPNQFTNGLAAAGITTPQNTAKVLATSDIVTTTGAPINPAAITVTSPPTKGTVSINASTGAVTYTPNAGYSGSDTFTVQLCDTSKNGSTAAPVCRSVTVPVTVGTNTVTAVNDSATTTPVTAVVVNVRANDTSATGQALAAPSNVSTPTNGTATVNGDNTITYTPNAGFSGTDSFTYRVCDTSTPTPVCSSTATVTVTVPNQFTNGPAASGITTPQNTAKVLATGDIVTTTGAPINPAGITVTSAPTKGTVSINASTGAVTFTPNAGYSGSDSFTVQLCDLSKNGTTAAPQCRSVVVPVIVGSNTVTAANDSATTNPVTAVDINVRANDTSATGQALATPSSVTAPGHGTATVNSDGTIRYTPASGFSGTDTFTYRVCDTSTPTAICSNIATVTVTVPNVFTNGPAAAGITTPQNTAKVLQTSDVVTTSGAPINPAATTLTTAPTKGTVSINTTTGAITYTPNAGTSGTDSFTVQLCDASVNGSTAAPQCKSVTVPVTVGVNTVTAANDSATTTPATAVDINVRANDTTVSGQPLVPPSNISTPSNGTAVVNANGTIRYTPANGFSGSDSFTYRVCDTSTPTPFCSNTATVSVTVPNAFTNGPAAAGVTTPQNIAKTLQTSDIVTTTGAPINPAAITVTSAPTKGTVAINATTGAVTYTPNPGYSGSDTLTVQLCDLSKNGTTAAPVCRSVVIPVTVGANTVTANPETVTTTPATLIDIDVRANDSTATGQPLANPTITGAPGHGTATVNADGTVRYTPAAQFSGSDSFVYRVCDTSTPTPVCSSTTTTVLVPNQFTNGPVAAGITTPQNTAKTLQTGDIITVTGAPINPAGITVTSSPAKGSVSINASTGAVTYTPNSGYSGSDTFTLQLCDTSVNGSTAAPVCRTVVIPVTVGTNTVTAGNDSATTNPVTAVTVNVRGNDTTATGQALANPSNVSTPGHGTATVNTDGTITYTPAAQFSGTDTFTYRVCDTSTPTPVCSNTATVTVTVPNVFTNGPAAAGITTPQNTAKVLATSAVVTTTGAPINPAGITVSSSPAHGAVTIDPSTGAITYTPTTGYAGSDSVTLQLCDSSLNGTTAAPQCRTVVVPITVGGNVVTAGNDTATTAPITAVDITVRANDTSATGQPLANPTVVTSPGHGTATVTSGGAITYTPATGFSGTDSFLYRVCDTSTPTAFCSANATVTVNVPNAFTNGPAAAGITTPQNTAKTLTTGDIVSVTGAPINPAATTVTSAPASGTISINTSTGSVTYTPNAGFSGSDSFVVRVCDTSVNGSTAAPVCRSVTIPVTVGINAVTAVDDTANTTPVTAVAISVTANDTTATGQALANPSNVSTPGHGTATVNANGTITYTPAAQFSGTDTFTYRVCDTSTPTPVCSNTATVTVTVPNQFTNGTAASGVTTPQNTAKTLQTGDIITVTGAPINPAAISVTTAPTRGSVSINSTSGAVTYTPDAGYSGSDSFTLQLCDRSVTGSTAAPVCRSVTVPLTVGSNAVTANADTASTPAVTPVDVNVRTNDTTATGQALANPVVATAPGHGSATVNANGTITYTPATSFSGTDTFTYTVCDTSTPTAFCSSPATVTVSVANVFTNGPAAAGVTTPQNTPKVLQSSDVVTTTGAPLNSNGITVTAQAAHGLARVNTTTGAITYTPTAGYTGADSFTLQLCDTSTPTPQCRTVVVPVTVGANTVTAVNDSASTTPGTAVGISVRANDTSASGQALANPTVATGPVNGTAVVNGGNGQIVYTPASGFSGSDSFTYTVCDTSTPTAVCSNTATVTVSVPNQFTNGPATGGVSTAQNTAMTQTVTQLVTVTGAAIDPAGVTVTTAPLHGSTTINATTGAVTYTPAAGYSGSDSYVARLCDTSRAGSTAAPVCYSVTIPITVGSNSVTAVDDTASTFPKQAVIITVKGNDSSSSGQPLGTPTIFTAPQPSRGIATVNADGTITYTPADGFSGTDSFVYRICDTSSPTPFCATATVTVDVPNQYTLGPAANGILVPENTTKVLQPADVVTVTGAIVNRSGVTLTTAPQHGTVSFDTNTGQTTYVPTPGYTGSDTFTLRGCDTSTPTPVCISITIPVIVQGNTVVANNDTATTTPGTLVAISVRANDTSASGQALDSPTIQTQPGHGTAAFNTTSRYVDYTPAAGFSGTDSFTYTVCDTSSPIQYCSNTATVTVTVPNQFTSGNPSISTPQNTAQTLSKNAILTTTGAPISNTGITVTSAASHGVVSIDTSNGAVTYTPDAGYSGSDSFTLQLCDTSVNGSTAAPVCRTVVVPVAVAGNTVTAVNDSATTAPRTPVDIPVRANDTSSSGQALANPVNVSTPGHGTATVITSGPATGSIRYTPATGFSGTDSFTYRVCDTSSPTPVCSATATVTVTVPNAFTNGAAATGVTTPQNTAKVLAIGDVVTTTGAPINPAGIAVAAAAAKGTVAIDTTTGAITYTPIAGASGADSFSLKLCDQSLDGTTAAPQCTTVTIPVTIGVNTVTAGNDSATTAPVTAVDINVRANDTTASGQALANPVIATAPGHGTAVVAPATGRITYTPASGFSGTDSFTYTVCDTSTPSAYCSNAATVTVSVPNAFTNGPAAAGVTTPQNTAKTLQKSDLVTTSGAPIDNAGITLAVAPAHGSVAISTTTGAVTYTPTPGYSGSDTFSVKLCDTSVSGSTAAPVCTTVAVPVSVGTNAVSAVDDTATTAPVTARVINVRANDTTATGQALANPVVATAPGHGTATVNPDGTITYTPAAQFSGIDRFTYTVCDTSTPTAVCSAPATVTATVPNAFTDGPAAAGITTPQNSSTTLTIANLTTTTGATISPARVTVAAGGAPVHGTLSINAATGAVTYTATPGYSGADSFAIQLCDNSLDGSTAAPQCTTVVVPVSVGANAVVAVNDSATTAPVTPIDINVRGNDTSATGQALAAPSTVSTPGHGSATVTGNGTIAYTPAAQFSGTDSFTYRVCDTSTPTPVCSNAATVTITVPNAFTPGTAAAGVSTAQNSSKVIASSEIATTTGAPVDPAGITVAAGSAPAHGSITISATTGAVTYTPQPGYSGSDTFALKVCDLSRNGTVLAPQCTTVTIPVTVGVNAVTAVDDTATTAPVTAIDLDVRANDTSTSGQALAAPTVTVAAGHGAAAVQADGRIRYTPAAGFSGTDRFTYRVCDTSTPTAVCSTAVATISVPNAFTDGTAHTGIATAQNTPRSIPIRQIVTTTGAAIDPAAVTVAAGGAPTHGTISIDGATGTVTYTPAPGYSGTDSFSIRSCDTSVDGTTAAPVCRVTSIPVTVGVNTVTASPDSAATSPSTLVTIPVKTNDTSASGQALGVPTISTAPGHGTATPKADGTIDYTPAAQFSGTDTFRYQVCDTSATPICATALVTVSVPNQFTPGTAASGVTTGQNVDRLLTIGDLVTVTGAPINPAAVTSATAPAHGSLVIDTTTGDVTYRPTPGYTGSDSFAIRLCDGSLNGSTSAPVCTTVTVPVTVGVNAVTANPDTASTTTVTPVQIPVLTNDTSSSGQALAAPTVTTSAGHGSTSVDPSTKVVTYTAATGFSGADSFIYRVCDTSTPTPVCATATATVNVANRFTPGPAAAGVSTGQNQAKTILASDIVTATGAPFAYSLSTITTPAAHGTASVNTTTGLLTYTPTPGYTGTDSFQVTYCDSATPRECTTRIVNVNVTPNAVTAGNDTATTSPTAAVVITVKANDTSASGQTLGAPTVTTAPAHAATSINPDGTVTYTPVAGFSGTDTFIYQVCDTSAAPVCASASVTVTVPNAFTAASATSGVSVAQNGSVQVPYTTVATTSGAPLRANGVTVTTGPLHGTTSVDTATGVITYIPAPGYTGSDSFVAQVCDSSTPTSVCRTFTVPVTVGANTVTANADTDTTAPVTPVTTNVVANDTSASGQALAAPTVTVAPQRGTAAIVAGGIRYTPAAGFSGTDSYTYRVCDTSTPAQCSSAVVTLTVPNTFTPGTAVTAGVTTPQNVAVTIPRSDVVTTTGAPVTAAGISLLTGPQHGTATVTPSNGAIVYTPANGYSGSDSITVRACDTSTPTAACSDYSVALTVGVNTVTAANDTATTNAPAFVDINVRANDTSSSGQPLAFPSVASAPVNGGTTSVRPDGTIRYTPPAAYSGTDSFTYQVCDTSAAPICKTASVAVTIVNLFTPGSAASGVSTPQNTAVTSSVAQLVTVSGSPINPTGVTVAPGGTPAHGALGIDPVTGAVTYTPAPGYSGSDSYRIRLCDTASPTACTTVAIPVTVGANTVTANPDSASTSAETAVAINVRANDTTASGQALGAPTVTAAPAHGTAAVLADNRIQYTPVADFSGTDTFSYRVCDTSSTPVCGIATVTVTVVNVFTDGPAASGRSTGQNKPTTLTVSDLVSVTGSPISPSRVTVASQPAHGTISIDAATGAVTYTPVPGYSGTDSVSIQLCDTSTPTPQCRTVVVPLTVGVNSVTAVADSATTPPVTAVTLNVRANDTSASGQALAIPTIVTGSEPGHGIVSISATSGAVTYTPDALWSGIDTFTYRVCDTSATPVCATAPVTITVPNRFIDGPSVPPGNVETPQNTPVGIRVSDIVTTTGSPIDNTSIVTGTPTSGTVSVDATNSVVTYTPNTGFSGSDSFGITLCDGGTPTPTCISYVMTVVTGNNAVAANDDSATTSAGADVAITVLANDTSASGQTLGVPTVTTAAAHGLTSVSGTGVITYTPNAQFSGADSFVYTLCDSSATPICDTATVRVTVDNVFTAGAAAAGVATTQNAPRTLTIADLVSVAGAPIDPTRVTVATPPAAAHGAVSVNATTGAVTYTPAPGYSGTDTFAVQLCDSSAPTVQCYTVTVPITVGVNTVAIVADTATTQPGVATSIAVRVNDTTSTGQAFGLPTVTGAPSHGSASPQSDGTIRYTPAAGFSGTDSFTYTLCDTSSTPVCGSALVTVDVPNTITPGTATGGVHSPVNGTIVIPVAQLASTTGAPVNPATVQVSSGPSHGTVTIDPDGTIHYTPATGYIGSDSMTVDFCDSSSPTALCRSYVIPVDVSTAAVAVNNDGAATTPGTAVLIDVLANDSSSTGKPFAAPTIVTPPAHGTASVGASGITYTPAAGFSGSDSVRYRVCETSATPVCGEAIVTISVPNTITPGAAASGVAVAGNGTAVIPVSRIATTTGAPISAGGVSILSGPNHGTVGVDPSTGAVTYTPTPGYAGTDSVAVHVCDGSTPVAQCADIVIPLTVAANVVAAGPDTATSPAVTAVTIPVTSNDTSSTGQPLGAPAPDASTPPAHGTVTVSGNELTYTPVAGFSGTDSFGYTVCDTSAAPVCATTTVTVTVSNVFTAGTAASGVTAPSGTPGTPITIPLGQLATTTGLPLDPTAVTIATPPVHGALLVDPLTGAVTYTPASGYIGNDTFRVTVCDQRTPAPECFTVTVPVLVSGAVVMTVNDAAVTTTGDTVEVDVMANDQSFTGNPLASPTIVGAPRHGRAAVLADGRIQYIPDPGYVGLDTLEYQLCDTSPTPVCSLATLSIEVDAAATAPAAGGGLALTGSSLPVLPAAASIAALLIGLWLAMARRRRRPRHRDLA